MEKCDRIGVMIRCGNLVITPCPVLVLVAPERDFFCNSGGWLCITP